MKNIVLIPLMLVSYAIHYIRYPFKKAYKAYPTACSYICGVIGFGTVVYGSYWIFWILSCLF